MGTFPPVMIGSFHEVLRLVIRFNLLGASFVYRNEDEIEFWAICVWQPEIERYEKQDRDARVALKELSFGSHVGVGNCAWNAQTPQAPAICGHYYGDQWRCTYGEARYGRCAAGRGAIDDCFEAN